MIGRNVQGVHLQNCCVRGDVPFYSCLKTPKASQLTLDSYSRILPQHISTARQQWAMVSKFPMKWHVLWTWRGQHCNIGFGANYNAFAIKRISQLATQCMMIQKCLSACNTPTIRNV
jgi:hypothetical protein